MNPREYQAFTRRLQENLQGDDRVTGLVALGSMAQLDYEPDIWSDHDFFVIVRSGEQEAFRGDLSWLPANQPILLSYRETAHGLKVLYESGHLLEFAVFDQHELYLARVNRFRVLLDKGGIQQHLERIREFTRGKAETLGDDHWLIGQFITNMLVGSGRYRRGEQLSGNFFVKTSGLRSLLLLLTKHIHSAQKNVLDDLDPHRRFEVAYPELGKELNLILSKEAPAAAKEMLLLAQRELQTRIQDYPVRASQVVLEYLER